MKKNHYPLFFFLTVLLLCTGWSSHYKEIADIKNYPQNLNAYIDKADAKTPLVSRLDQTHLNMEYNTRYFAPWNRRNAGYSKKDAIWAFGEFRNQTGYDETKKEWAKERIDEIEQYAALNTFPNKELRGITVRDTSLRMIPTEKPFFYDFDLEGEGFPFDNFQHSSLPSNTPLFISHTSRDGAWALVETHYGLGWIPMEDVAYATQGFIDSWQNGNYVAITQYDVPLLTTAGSFLFKTSIGSQFPVISETPTDYIILAARSDVGKMATALRAKISKDRAALKPLPLTTQNLANIGNQFIGKSYGWGGLYGNRDCSSLAKDFFAPFGIYLPRNSSDQIKMGISSIDLSKYSRADKKNLILQKGIPFLTLLGMKGHMMIYIGPYQNEPMVFHSTWGIRTSDWLDADGRHLVAKAAITTLEAGKELENRNPMGELLYKTNRMTFLTD